MHHRALFTVLSLVLLSTTTNGQQALVLDRADARYSEVGPYPVAVDLSVGPGESFTLFRPIPEADSQPFPVITWGNGTFAIPQFYQGFLEHLASWGFVVIASNSPFTGSGQQMIEGVDWVLAQQGDPTSVLYQRVDTQAIGATGHSQGGGGAINAGTDPRVRCTAPIENIPGDVQQLQGPTLILAGLQDNVVPAAWIARSTAIPSVVPTVFAVHREANHLTPLGDGGVFRGVVTAWFRALLRGDSEAQQVFAANCELCQDPEWLVFRKSAP